jgi:hypothetical protein
MNFVKVMNGGFVDDIGSEVTLRLSAWYNLPETAFQEPYMGMFMAPFRSGPGLQKFTLSVENIPKLISSQKFSEIEGRYYQSYDVDWWTPAESFSAGRMKAYESEGETLELWIDHSSGECFVINYGGM